ncbi:hypothetical protein ABK040_011516 [Willaertia magna]
MKLFANLRRKQSSSNNNSNNNSSSNSPNPTTSTANHQHQNENIPQRHSALSISSSTDNLNHQQPIQIEYDDNMSDNSNNNDNNFIVPPTPSSPSEQQNRNFLFLTNNNNSINSNLNTRKKSPLTLNSSNSGNVKNNNFLQKSPPSSEAPSKLKTLMMQNSFIVNTKKERKHQSDGIHNYSIKNNDSSPLQSLTLQSTQQIFSLNNSTSSPSPNTMTDENNLMIENFNGILTPQDEENITEIDSDNEDNEMSNQNIILNNNPSVVNQSNMNQSITSSISPVQVNNYLLSNNFNYGMVSPPTLQSPLQENFNNTTKKSISFYGSYGTKSSTTSPKTNFQIGNNFTTKNNQQTFYYNKNCVTKKEPILNIEEYEYPLLGIENNSNYRLSIDQVINQLTQEFENLEEIDVTTWLHKKLYFKTAFKFMEMNRYSNVLPNEDTRVVLYKGLINPLLQNSLQNNILENNENLFEEDYINANLIKCRNIYFMDWEDFIDNSLQNTLQNNNRKEREYLAEYCNAIDYICTQGPLQNTITHFWKMIYQQFSKVIVMLSKENECGKLKCDIYWPTVDNCNIEIFRKNNILLYLTLQNVNSNFDWIVKDEILQRNLKLILQKDLKIIEERNVTLIQYVGWPDFGIPSDLSSFERLIEYVNCHVENLKNYSNNNISPVSSVKKVVLESHVGNIEVTSPTTSSYNSYSPNSNVGMRKESTSVLDKIGPLVVHCSAGIGRTGTFCGIDIIMKQFIAHVEKYKGSKIIPKFPLNIFQVVRKLKEHRSGMVQTEAQYEFIYKVVCKFIRDLKEKYTRNEKLTFK